ncbi:MAG TPA: hypothetical protein VM753_05500 [Anaeromyxobacter sp.]|jgi:hypothetical protein|nr:hypothetical protein [Anaeromyxobacter sp.]
MPTKTEMEWDIRDELAAMFMQAIITGRYAEGRDPAVEAKASARRAYDMAAEFLAVRGEVADQAGNSKEPGEPATAEP